MAYNDSTMIKEPSNTTNDIRDGEGVQTKGPALVLGASGAQGRCVLEGLADRGYSPIYGGMRDTSSSAARYARDAIGSEMLVVDLSDAASVHRALVDSGATSIFLVTTTDTPTVHVTNQMETAEED